ncbi:MAG: hypothetical protein HYW50_02105 [Candidatus Diapherotrites archaeon]|nr:hypothetical protein [Candidatus Diapherotrites archaeon]
MYSPQESSGRFKYESPGEISDELDIEEETPAGKAKEILESAGDAVKKNWLKILALIIAVGILFFAFDFFVGSVKKVSFNVTDTEGARLSGVGIKVFDLSGTEIEKISASTPIDLRRGIYTAAISLSGYRPKSAYSFEVVENPTEVVVALEKDWDIEIDVQDFPQKLVEGQHTGVFVSVKNNREKEEKIDLVFEGALGPNYMSAGYPSPMLSPPGETRVFVELKVKENLQPNLIKNELKGTIRVRGLDNAKAKKQFTFDMQEFDRSKLKVSGSAKFGTVVEGTVSPQKEITIQNNLDFPVEDIRLEVEIKSTQFSQPSEAKEWFSFDREIPIKVLQPGDGTKVGMIASVPVGVPFQGSTEKETIIGKLFLRTSFWEEEVDLDLIVQKSRVQLVFSGISQSNTVSFSQETGTYLPVAKILSLQNKGQLPLTFVNLNAECNSSGNWNAENVVAISQTLFEEIPAGGEKKTNYTFLVPNSASSGDIANCKMTANYDDPRNRGERLSAEYEFIISIR